ncbi:MAG: type VI secretion system accessory protein TagJ [Terriglobia bacterium]
MTAKELFQSGKLDDAVQALTAEVRNHPSDLRARTFLFELLCFAGQFDRAEKQLDVAVQGDATAELGALVYRAALNAEKTRQDAFEKKQYRKSGADVPPSPAGSLNGRPFASISDGDPRVGPRLEVFAAGSFMWIPFEHIASVEMEAPKRLRDILWAPASVKTGPSFKGVDLGDVLLPALAPFSWQSADDAARLGRATFWVEGDNGDAVPVGQKLLVVDGEEEFPFLELRKLEFKPAPPV